MTEGLEQFRQYLVNPEAGEQLPVSMIGLVLYADAQKATVIGTSSSGNLLSGNLNVSEIGQDSLDIQPSRMLRLDKFNEIDIVQLDLGAIEIATQHSVRQSKPAVTVRFSYIDPNTGQEKKHILQEKQLLDLMIGKQGGLAVFYGDDNPEENALVIEDANSSGKSAIVAFIHPTDAVWGIDSINGVAGFFHKVADEFLAKTELPKEVRSAIEQLEDQKEKIPDNGARIEILKATLIAHARLAQQTGDPVHQQFLDKHLVNFKPGCLSLLFPNDSQSMDNISKAIDEAAQSLIITKQKSRKIETIPPPEQKAKTAKPKKEPLSLRDSLKTQKVRDLFDFFHTELGERFGSETKDVEEPMSLYLLKIAEYILDTHSLDELDDCDVLLQELSTTAYGKDQRLYDGSLSMLIFSEALMNDFNGLGVKHEPPRIAKTIKGSFIKDSGRCGCWAPDIIYRLRESLNEQKIFETNRMFEEKMRAKGYLE